MDFVSMCLVIQVGVDIAVILCLIGHQIMLRSILESYNEIVKMVGDIRR